MFDLTDTRGASGDIFLNGATVEHSHGLGATLLSVVAVRSGEIAVAISP
ncbi:hypothetical protein [Mycolicibacterium sp. HS_4_1]